MLVGVPHDVFPKCPVPVNTSVDEFYQSSPVVGDRKQPGPSRSDSPSRALSTVGVKGPSVYTAVKLSQGPVKIQLSVLWCTWNFKPCAAVTRASNPYVKSDLRFHL